MATAAEINVTIFEQPSGNVRGMVTAFMPIKGKQKRIAHAILLVDETPSVSLFVPSKLPLDEVAAVAANLTAFAAKVHEVSKASGADPQAPSHSDVQV